jgi:hypothetical protein
VSDVIILEFKYFIRKPEKAMLAGPGSFVIESKFVGINKQICFASCLRREAKLISPQEIDLSQSD